MLIFALLAWRAWPSITGILLSAGFIGAAAGSFRPLADITPAGMSRINLRLWTEPLSRFPGLT